MAFSKPAVSTDWKTQNERSNSFWIWLIFSIGTRLGRPASRALLPFIVFYFLLFSRQGRHHSKHYLSLVLKKPPGFVDFFRHIHSFASTILDRLYFFAGKFHWFQISNDQNQLFDPIAREQRGAILMISHVGSFDALRLAVLTRKDNLRLRVIMDLSHAQTMNQVLNSINPDFMQSIIDSSAYDGAGLMLRIREELALGTVVAIMADRLQHPTEPVVSGYFLGDRVNLPASPWHIACIMQVPIFMGMGLYCGGNRYQLRFKALADGRPIPRNQRKQAVQSLTQSYLHELEDVLKLHPYNWFNFYDFWAQSADQIQTGATAS